jgi:hypothetical protein
VLDCAANPRRDGAVVCRGRSAYLLQELGWEANGHGGGQPAAPWSLGFLVFRAGVELVFLVGGHGVVHLSLRYWSTRCLEAW